MIYLLALFIPPLAVLIAGKPLQAVLNILLCLLFYLPGVIHALLVVQDAKAERRLKKLARRLKDY